MNHFVLTFSLWFWTKAPVSTNAVVCIVNRWCKKLLVLEDYTDFDIAWAVTNKVLHSHPRCKWEKQTGNLFNMSYQQHVAILTSATIV